MNANGPETLLEAARFFDVEVATEFFVRMRWPDRVTCPHCGSTNVLYLPNQRRWKCREKHARPQFSAKIGTIFEESPLGLDKWFVAVWAITNAKNGISSCELARAIGITQKSAWFLLHRVRHAMHTGTFEKFAGVIEADETFVGGKSFNKHLGKRTGRRGAAGKSVVMGLLERHTSRGKKDPLCSKVRTFAVPNNKKKTVQPIVREHVETDSHVYTDALKSYEGLAEYTHKVIDHAERYVDGIVHTNGMENFWALFKRCIKGTYVAVDDPHLQRYLDEEVFRFNERKLTDGERFHNVMPGVVGKRLTYKALIGTNDSEVRIAGDDGESPLPN